jgi:glycosyltransferase involved in cell wall biosynthesis
VLRDFIEGLQPGPATQRFFGDPNRLIGTRVLVVKSPRDNERGLIIMDYSFVFSLVMNLFDFEAIASRYFLVLEPSWSGYADLDILCYAHQTFPVFVQAAEPRDAAFLRTIAPNLVPVPIAANWWVDHRIMRPLEGVAKDVDIVMAAAWAPFKRHHRFFSVLQRLRARGHPLRAVLIGYPAGSTKSEIMQLAEHYGVRDQIEMYEWLSPEQVNVQFNRARVSIIWSRREGVNRAIVESMFANVPCLVRDGFNFGYRYQHINESTGRYATDRNLDAVLLEMCSNERRWSPREWVLEHMSCQAATRVLTENVKATAIGLGEHWTTDPVVKVGSLNQMAYWTPEDQASFSADYAFLRMAIRRK